MRFIHFGCWNEFGYKIKSKTKSALTYTLDELKKYTKSNKTDFIIIAGDNYYKSIKQSSYDDENYKYFKSGFDGLPKSIKKYLIFGNHDINDQIKLSKPLKRLGDTNHLRPIKDKLYPNLEDITTTNCKILNLQQKYGDNSKQKYTVFNDILFHEYNLTLIIMLDSNILNLFNKMNIGCYKYLFDSFEKTNSTTMNELILHQINSIIKLIESKKHIQNFIFVGHHPILACKNSKDKLIVVKNEGLVNLFTNQQLHSLINNKNIFYLCADVHLYQYGLVTINSLNIKQYIVGTGGAHLDNYKENETEFRNVYGIKGLNYKLLDNYNNIHGFLVVDIDTIDSNDIISFKFNPSVNINKTTSKQVSKTVSTIENTYLNILQGGYDSTNVEYIDIKK
jgi:predicted MPP superfamily phosphohydrolase